VAGSSWILVLTLWRSFRQPEIFRCRGGIGERGWELWDYGPEENSHIDGGKSTVGDGTADRSGESESRVERDTAELLGRSGKRLLHDGIDLGRAGGGRRNRGGAGHRVY
jgi:hypothetical protein